MDVKIAFLNGDLKEKIYMEQHEGFVIPGKENKELNGPAACLVKSGEVKYSHFIFKLDFADWELMKKAVPEGEELMPNRDITTGPVFTEANIPNSDISANPVLNEAYKLVPVDDSQLRLRVTRVKKLSRKHGKVLREVSDVDNSPETGSPKFAMGA
ncbi:putative non-structural maintenance of chromosomes element 4 -like protein A-like [Capsicum annuum]|nr:putative non-structural maintenance of chromosomes element 4 -like protein A-like [Capsicum annuum]